MKNGKTEHFWRIHAKVARRLWLDLSDRERLIIASDADHVSDTFEWFDKKVMADATRLYEDPTYFDNQEFTFRVADPKVNRARA